MKPDKYHGCTKPEFLIFCARNIIMQVPCEQDHLLVDYGDEISSTIVEYLHETTKENLEMIYLNKFDFKMKFNEVDGVFRMKFEYWH